MIDFTQRGALGSYQLTRPLPGSGAWSEMGVGRFLALHEADQSSHTVYLFPGCLERESKRRFLSAVERCARLDNPHLLKIEHYAFDLAARPWIVTPFVGDATGLITLAGLLRAKGGQMPMDEADRAVTHLLEASIAAGSAPIGAGPNAGPVVHGPMSLDDVLVDSRGSLRVELYGLARLLKSGGAQSSPGWGEDEDARREEVRSIVQIAYQLITGLVPEEPLIPAHRLVRKLDARWASFLSRGLEPAGGFDRAEDALAFLRRAGDREVTVRPARSVLSLLRPR